MELECITDHQKLSQIWKCHKAQTFNFLKIKNYIVILKNSCAKLTKTFSKKHLRLSEGRKKLKKLNLKI